MILHHFVSLELTEKTGVESITAEKGVYTLGMADGSKMNAALHGAEFDSVETIIKKVIDKNQKKT